MRKMLNYPLIVLHWSVSFPLFDAGASLALSMGICSTCYDLFVDPIEVSVRNNSSDGPNWRRLSRDGVEQQCKGAIRSRKANCGSYGMSQSCSILLDVHPSLKMSCWLLKVIINVSARREKNEQRSHSFFFLT